MDNIHKEDEVRPWGKFEVFAKNEQVTVKIVTVNQGEKFSLQYHTHRNEFWRILSGNPLVTIADKTIQAKKGDEFMVTAGMYHRVEAQGDTVEFLEIGFGVFDEKDIVRTEDKYGRT